MNIYTINSDWIWSLTSNVKRPTTSKNSQPLGVGTLERGIDDLRKGHGHRHGVGHGQGQGARAARHVPHGMKGGGCSRGVDAVRQDGGGKDAVEAEGTVASVAGKEAEDVRRLPACRSRGRLRLKVERLFVFSIKYLGWR